MESGQRGDSNQDLNLQQNLTKILIFNQRKLQMQSTNDG